MSSSLFADTQSGARFADIILPLNLPQALTYGIPTEMQKKIFSPNFTKNTIEQKLFLRFLYLLYYRPCILNHFSKKLAKTQQSLQHPYPCRMDLCSTVWGR